MAPEVIITATISLILFSRLLSYYVHVTRDSVGLLLVGPEQPPMDAIIIFTAVLCPRLFISGRWKERKK